MDYGQSQSTTSSCPNLRSLWYTSFLVVRLRVQDSDEEETNERRKKEKRKRRVLGEEESKMFTSSNSKEAADEVPRTVKPKKKASK